MAKFKKNPPDIYFDFPLNITDVFRYNSSTPAYAQLTRNGYSDHTGKNEWLPDVLGPGFMYHTLRLDSRGDTPQSYATLVRHDAVDDPGRIPKTPDEPQFICLFVHGWNDYFYQREYARHISLAGGKFYALDLREYGRSLQPDSDPCWITDLRYYGAEFDAALDEIRKAYPRLPLILSGHSTGGLIVSLWAHAHSHLVDGMILNSPWIELQTGIPSRHAFAALLVGLQHIPTLPLAPRDSTSVYAQSFDGWKPEYGPLPQPLEPWKTDPSVSGWIVNDAWKDPDGRYVRAAWLNAIIEGQNRVAAGLHIDFPVYLQVSQESYLESQWSVEAFIKDTVLDADLLVKRMKSLGNDVVLQRLLARHDVMLSYPPVRQHYWLGLHRWLYERFTAIDNNPLPALVPDDNNEDVFDLGPIGTIPASSYLAVCP